MKFEKTCFSDLTTSLFRMLCQRALSPLPLYSHPHPASSDHVLSTNSVDFQDLELDHASCEVLSFQIMTIIQQLISSPFPLAPPPQPSLPPPIPPNTCAQSHHLNHFRSLFSIITCL